MNYETYGKGNKPYYLVLDFEANCSAKNTKDHEIIEFPAVLVDAKNNQCIAEFRYFVKTNSGKKLSTFIKNLTHITDEQMFKGLTFYNCLVEFEKWCYSNKISWESTTVITVGDWDLETMLHRQLQMEKIKLSKFLNDLFGCWTNIKIPFSMHTRDKPYGMAGMLAYFELELEGHHHSGIDDCRNTAKICNELIKLGIDITKPTNYRNEKFWYPEHKLPYEIKGDKIVKC